jgi:hypothetical protein
VLILSFETFLFGDVSFLYPYMQKSKVYDSISVIMINTYYPHYPFPSRNWRTAYQSYENHRVTLITPLTQK